MIIQVTENMGKILSLRLIGQLSIQIIKRGNFFIPILPFCICGKKLFILHHMLDLFAF